MFVPNGAELRVLGGCDSATTYVPTSYSVLQILSLSPGNSSRRYLLAERTTPCSSFPVTQRHGPASVRAEPLQVRGPFVVRGLHADYRSIGGNRHQG